jgi:hypothetical protein
LVVAVIKPSRDAVAVKASQPPVKRKEFWEIVAERIELGIFT